MSDLSVDDVLKLLDGLKEKGISSFKGLGMEIESGIPRKKDKAKKLTPEVPVKHAADIALENNSRRTEDEEDE